MGLVPRARTAAAVASVEMRVMCRGRAAVTPKACTDYADPDGMQSSSAATACYGWMSTPKGWFLRIPPKKIKIIKKYEFNEIRWNWNEFKWILHIFSQATFQRRSRDPHLKIGSLACPLRHGDTTVVTIRWRFGDGPHMSKDPTL